MAKLIILIFIVIFPKLILGQKDSTFLYIDSLQNEKCINYLNKKIKKNNYNKGDMLSKQIDIYNLACAYSLNNDPKKCFETLNTLLKNKMDPSAFEKDPDFYNVSHTKEWNAYLLNYKKQHNLNFIDTIYTNLSQIAINDQAYYRHIKFYEKRYGQKSSKALALWKIKDSLNKTNLKLVIHYIDNGYNVLSDSVVGKFSKSCFMVIQHADMITMEKFLPIIKKLYDKKQTSGGNYALLYDRVYLHKNKGMQYYGSQINTETNQPYLIKDEKNVDKRRAELGMESMKEYLQRFNVIYNSKRRK
jgi:hypothetical protein